MANIKFIDYSEEIKKLTEDEAKKQIIEQIYTISVIADQKMKSVQKSIKSFIVLVFFATLLLIFI